MLNGTIMIIRFIVRVILITFYKTNQYVTKMYNCSGWNARVELDLSSYPTKFDVKINRCRYIITFKMKLIQLAKNQM